MLKSRVHNWMMLVLGCVIVAGSGCSMNVKELGEAGFFDFVTGTITDALTALVPIADTITNAT